ncbi:hypothetical protein LDENG_00215190 [Lucifuga dentata]|nr:hypothetical protein LDENG_00215190 [Lucifuga dentata]
MLITAEPPPSMEKSSQIHASHPLRPRVMPRKDRKDREKGKEVSVLPVSHLPRASKAQRLLNATPERKERLKKENPKTNEENVEQEEVRIKSTVVDIDSVREDEQTEENLGLLEIEEQEYGLKSRNLGVFEWLLMVFVLTLVLLFFPLSIWFCVKVVTKDLVRPELSAVCYYQIENVALCSSSLSSLTTVLETLVQAVVRDILAQHTFSHILLHRRRVGQQIQASVDSVVCRWGLRVERADIRDELSLPVEFQQNLATEAKSKRQQQLRVKAAEGERAAWEVFRTSFHHLNPALVLPLPPDLLTLTPDLSALPPPPPPAVEGEGGMKEGELKTDSPMM